MPTIHAGLVGVLCCLSLTGCGTSTSEPPLAGDPAATPGLTIQTAALHYVAGQTIDAVIANFGSDALAIGSCADIQRFDGSSWVPRASNSCPNPPTVVQSNQEYGARIALQEGLRGGTYRLLLIAYTDVTASELLPVELRGSMPFRVFLAPGAQPRAPVVPATAVPIRWTRHAP